jgi:hypothetical protein
LPVASIALIRGRATGTGSEITPACGMSFASREKTIISQWEVGVGMIAGGRPHGSASPNFSSNSGLKMSGQQENQQYSGTRSIQNQRASQPSKERFTVRQNIDGGDLWGHRIHPS